jgi:hypothetical protein
MEKIAVIRTGVAAARAAARFDNFAAARCVGLQRPGATPIISFRLHHVIHRCRASIQLGRRPYPVGSSAYSAVSKTLFRAKNGPIVRWTCLAVSSLR